MNDTTSHKFNTVKKKDCSKIFHYKNNNDVVYVCVFQNKYFVVFVLPTYFSSWMKYNMDSEKGSEKENSWSFAKNEESLIKIE
jgi:hypothetical protein